jgi:membrane fusion protein, heavy metal efflux system
VTRAALSFLLALAACGQQPASEKEAERAAPQVKSDEVVLTRDQIASAGIELVSPSVGGSGGAIELPATIEGDPDATRVVAAPIEGRIIALTRNLGDAVRAGDTLAVLESRAAADLQADVERAQTRLTLARATRDRDEALYRRGFRALRDVEISRAAFDEAETTVRLARQQVAASGVRGGSLNRIVITAPIGGRVIARSAVLGQVFTTNATETELFRIADTRRLSVAMALSPADAATVRPGAVIAVTAPGRRTAGRIGFVSPALDPKTKLVPAVGRIDNANGRWRVGEPVTVTVERPGGGDASIRVPTTAVQTVEGRTMVFVRTDNGFRATPVTLGAQDGDAVLVTQGLAGRERIAAANSFTLKSALGAVADED